MSHANVVERWEDGKPTPIPPHAKVRTHSGGGSSTHSSQPCTWTATYKSGYSTLTILQPKSFSRFGSRPFVQPGGGGSNAYFNTQKSTDWGTTIDALGFTIGSHTMRILVPRENIEAIQRLLFEQWPQGRRKATARDVLSMAGKLWNLTYAVRAGRYFVRRLVRLTKLHNAGGRKNQNRTVGLGIEFYADFLLCKWAIDHELLHEGEALSAPCYTVIQRLAKRHTCLTPVSRQ